MKRILMVTVATIILLWSTTPITAHALSRLQIRTFSKNLVKGEYVEAETVDEEPEESVDDEPIDVAEEIITDPDEIEKSEDLDEQEPQEPDEHTDVSTPTDIESVVNEDTGDLDQMEEPIETDATESDEMIEEYVRETEEEHETEVQGPE